MSTTRTWKDELDGQMPEELAREIDIFETQIELRKQGKMDEKLFAETRLRRGVYGQRYDNGQRHDGVATRPLDFPCGDLTKGPETVWDAPGMMRIKIPMGVLSAAQIDVLAETAEEYSDSILHVTTRQDIQLHFVHIEDTPAMMRRLAAVGITTREACGNSVRNVTACQFAGVCNDQSFDVTPYAHALTYYFLGHRDVQDFGRKFKIAFSGCHEHACGLAYIHDIGAVAVKRQVGDKQQRGFTLYVGGGLGSVPHQAKVLEEFVSEEELLPLCQAVCRVFSRLGERKNRNRARLKFVVAKLGIEEFRKVVREERDGIPHDERWTTYLGDLGVTEEKPLKPGRALEGEIFPKGFRPWRETNVRPQAQDGYVVATVRLPLGDFTSDQARYLADMARRYTGDTVRLTVEQNLVFRWLPEADLPAFYKDLSAVGLAEAGAGTISDITACPGTDTCKLGISASRGLAGELEERLADKLEELPAAARALRIKTSGCFNSCGQHHIADIGFLGVSRNVGGRRVAHFQLVVGGKWRENGGAYGLAIGAFPAKRVPQVIDRLVEFWTAERDGEESLQDFIQRTGRAKLKQALDDLRAVPAYEDDPSFYVDWGDDREYTIGDIGVGECAGEVVSFTDFGLADSEREVFEAQVALDEGDAARATERAFSAMLQAAKALIRTQHIDVTEDADTLVGEFRTRFHDTKLFHDKYAGAKFAQFFFRMYEQHKDGSGAASDAEHAHQNIEEAQLFIEAAHACYDRLQESAQALP
ncbi:nitrite/sulfite reductase [Haliangium ochraceum]|uniref:Nitrite and sulphite reductase 4Fe-4S region n=1 Tax=Haliangium ochraceum (strain DSM 14365 / JCM 11303 / SMP-2) TaxID=502025 RepID=D0LWF7_HALO1|nr:nitrite/sulfite reductase [Haliangium ochraceum]ACY17607.1 nitrite and sulphite reductase 4Fe-4S region [Haliangium ochraceum DSM 14365]